MIDYLPEGMNLRRGGFTAELLRKAMADGTVLQAVATVCTKEHDLLVDLGCCMGRICRDETALGIRDGTVRDIAVLSRVGKPVSFRVLQVPAEGPALLSRRLAQEDALAHFLSVRRPGDIIPTTVTGTASFGAFCDIGCGVSALMGIEAISVSRIGHSGDRFREDQQIFAVVRHIDRDAKRIQLTHRELLGTWAENAADFQAGQTVIGTVRSIKDYGAFIELTPNLSGLAEPNPDLRVGDTVSVYIKSILPERLKIKLVALRRLDGNAQPAKPLRYFRTAGHMDRWQYGSGEKPGAVTVF